MAFTEFYTNKASCVLTAGYTAGDPSITVSSTTGDDANYPFPVTAPFRLSLWTASTQTFKVILKVTAITDGTHFAVTAEGHDANAASGDTCYGVITAAALTAIRTDAGTVANLTGLGTNVGTWLGTPSSANLAAALTDETGTGAAVFANTPTLVTPVLGTPTSGTLTNCDGTANSLTSGITKALKSATTTVDVSAATAPSSGQVLTATASTTATWQTPSSGGSFTLVEQHTASASAALNFTTGITGTYDTYRITFLSVLPATNQANLILEFSTDGGSTYDTTAGHYTGGFFVFRAGGSAVGGGGNSAANIAFSTAGITVGLSNATNEGASGELLLTFLSGKYASVGGTLVFLSGDGTNYVGASCMGRYLQTTNPNAFRIKFDTGNITSGVVRLYGLAK